MASKLFSTLLFILPVIYARKLNTDHTTRIEVKVIALENEEIRTVNFTGSNRDVISDVERETFQLSDINLKDGVARYFGKRPSNVYVKNPTPWGDIYHTYNWPQVTRIFTPQITMILDVRKQPIIVQTQELIQNTTKTANFSVNIQQEVQNTVSSSWEKMYALTVAEAIEYDISIEGLSVNSKSSFSYTSKWGEGVSKSENVTVGSSGVQITLEPSQQVTAELHATRSYMEIKVGYDAYLSGRVVVAYDDSYKGHHFWALDINAIMNARGLERTKRSRESIKLDCYTDSKVVIKDRENNKVLYTIPL